MIHGLQPGPLLMKRAPDLFWGTIVSMYIGNGMLLVLNLPLIPLWVMVLRVPYYLLYPLILLFCVIGSYSIGNSIPDVVMMLIFGVVGYLLRKFRYDAPPLVLALVLGGELEASLRQSLMMSQGDFSIFVQRPITVGFPDSRRVAIDRSYYYGEEETFHPGGVLLAAALQATSSRLRNHTRGPEECFRMSAPLL